MVFDRDRSCMPATGQGPPRPEPRKASIVSVAVLGHNAKPRPNARRRGPLLRAIIEAIVARSDWPPIDVVLLPGGFFRLRSAIGAFGEEARRLALIGTKAADQCAEASRLLEEWRTGAVLAVGIDTDPVSKKVGGDQLVTAWTAGELVALTRKTFPCDGDTNGSWPSYPVFDVDFTSPSRFVMLPSGHRSLLLGCYDAFGTRSLVDPRHADLSAIRLAEDWPGSLHEPSIQLRRYFLACWRTLIAAYPPDLALCAIHGFVRPGMDGYWQRHGIAGASAALGSIPVIGASHFNKALPRSVNRSVLAAKEVPVSHLELGPHRPMHALIPDDGFILTDEGGNSVALIRRFDLALGQNRNRNIS